MSFRKQRQSLHKVATLRRQQKYRSDPQTLNISLSRGTYDHLHKANVCIVILFQSCIVTIMAIGDLTYRSV